MRALNVFFALLFAFSVVVQYNDPDPVRWMAIYASALAGCVLWELQRLRRIAALAVCLVGLAWGVWSAFGTHLTVPVGEALSDWQMHAGGSEELRESLGLFLVAIWMGALWLRPERTPPRA